MQHGEEDGAFEIELKLARAGSSLITRLQPVSRHRRSTAPARAGGSPAG